jgi:polyhydroxyalkanoate synthesis regulator phasin
MSYWIRELSKNIGEYDNRIKIIEERMQSLEDKHDTMHQFMELSNKIDKLYKLVDKSVARAERIDELESQIFHIQEKIK